MVVWDGGLSAQRVAALPEYKAQRPEMPDDLRPQFDGLRDYLSAAGVADYCGDGIEADDYIACLARHGADAGWNVVIASADKDFMQLVSDRIGFAESERQDRRYLGARTGTQPRPESSRSKSPTGWL
jgi:DNA polymerase I